ncbi:S-layer homology domain-containing protein [Acetoanaerobium noterae]|uniref:S-layer homology domain-containing protein n=1 Tax=Acetoanaerobium noterae TaxID=745369 RepID=UPI003242F75B
MEKANLIPDALKDDADLTKNVSREEFAELITTYYNAVEKQTSIPSPSESKFTDTKNPLIVMANQAEKQLTNIGQTKNIDKFSDKAKIADWAKESVGSLSNAGGIGGYPDGTFKPTNNMTKQEAIALVSNLAVKAGLIEKPTAPTAASIYPQPLKTA